MHTAIPNHLAIIPDGNRRWAIAHKKKAVMGHRAGVAITDKILEKAFQSGVQYVTMWGASEDNLRKRTPEEVRALCFIFIRAFKKTLSSKKINQYGARIYVVGKYNEILKNKELRDVIHDVEQKTKKNTEKVLTILLGYDGMEEMKDAISLLKDKKSPITFESIHDALATRHLPPVDLVIRTGDDPHWSAGFMMWLTANSEFYFTNTLWPAFSTHELSRAFSSYASRRRMHGK